MNKQANYPTYVDELRTRFGYLSHYYFDVETLRWIVWDCVGHNLMFFKVNHDDKLVKDQDLKPIQGSS